MPYVYDTDGQSEYTQISDGGVDVATLTKKDEADSVYVLLGGKDNAKMSKAYADKFFKMIYERTQIEDPRDFAYDLKMLLTLPDAYAPEVVNVGKEKLGNDTYYTEEFISANGAEMTYYYHGTQLEVIIMADNAENMAIGITFDALNTSPRAKNLAVPDNYYIIDDSGNPIGSVGNPSQQAASVVLDILK